jgi:hypothetical protein
MAQLRWWMALIGVLIVGSTGAAWAAEEAAGEAPESGMTLASAAALFAQCRAVAATPSTLRNGPTRMWCVVGDREGTLLLINATDTAGTPQSPNGSDAWWTAVQRPSLLHQRRRPPWSIGV